MPPVAPTTPAVPLGPLGPRCPTDPVRPVNPRGPRGPSSPGEIGGETQAEEWARTLPVNAGGAQDEELEELGAAANAVGPTTANAQTASNRSLRQPEPNISRDLPFLARVPGVAGPRTHWMAGGGGQMSALFSPVGLGAAGKRPSSQVSAATAQNLSPNIVYWTLGPSGGRKTSSTLREFSSRCSALRREVRASRPARRWRAGRIAPRRGPGWCRRISRHWTCCCATRRWSPAGRFHLQNCARRCRRGCRRASRRPPSSSARRTHRCGPGSRPRRTARPPAWSHDSLGVVWVDRWQVSYLTFRKGEPYAVVDLFHGADGIATLFLPHW